MNRRDFAKFLTAAGLSNLIPNLSSPISKSFANESFYDIPSFGNARLLHITDTHAQLLPVYFREPGVNIGIRDENGKPPHLVGKYFLDYFGIKPGSIEAHALTAINYIENAEQYGKVGGYAHLCTLVKNLRQNYGSDSKSLLLDGGDTWQGSATAYWTRGKDMVGASNLLGVDVMTGHWEFTYQDTEILENIADFDGEFIAHNVRVNEDALFDGKPAYDEDSGHAFKPYTIKEMGDKRVAVIGQAFPYTPIANPSRFIPDWSFGIQANGLQSLIDEIKVAEKPDAIILLSHNGMDVDLKLAEKVSGIDVILGGHTHDGVPKPVSVKNKEGKTLVTNAGSNGKFIGVLDLEIGKGKINDFQYHLLPVFSNLVTADQEMESYIHDVRKPYEEQLTEKVAVTNELLYRRGNFNGSFDQVICDALREVNQAEIALSPGFRWGTTILPGGEVTMEDIMSQTCITYPETYTREMTGEQIKAILEDVCDNLFNIDPFYRQGGDMVRTGGMNYVCDPVASIGNRITDMTLDNGDTIEAGKTYKVSGWATVNSKAPGMPIWDVVKDYMKSEKEINIKELNVPVLKNMQGNKGIIS